MVTSIGRMYIKPGSEKAALAALKKLAGKVRKEEGTLVYLVHTPDPKSPSFPPVSPLEVTFYEVYKDKKALQAHLDGAFKEFASQSVDLFLNAPSGGIFVEFLSATRIAGFIKQ